LLLRGCGSKAGIRFAAKIWRHDIWEIRQHRSRPGEGRGSSAGVRKAKIAAIPAWCLGGGRRTQTRMLQRDHIRPPGSVIIAAAVAAGMSV